MSRRTTGRQGDRAAVYACDGGGCPIERAAGDGRLPAGWTQTYARGLTEGAYGPYRKLLCFCPAHAGKAGAHAQRGAA